MNDSEMFEEIEGKEQEMYEAMIDRDYEMVRENLMFKRKIE